MIRSIKIANNMSCEYICYHIHQAILAYQKDHIDLADCWLTIDIKKVSYDINIIPKLEFHNDKS